MGGDPNCLLTGMILQVGVGGVYRAPIFQDFRHERLDP